MGRNVKGQGLGVRGWERRVCDLFVTLGQFVGLPDVSQYNNLPERGLNEERGGEREEVSPVGSGAMEERQKKRRQREKQKVW